MKQPVARLECTSCGHTEYKMTAKPVGEEIPDSCSRCHGDMVVKERDKLPSQLDMVGGLVNEDFYVWDFSMTSKRMKFLVESDNPKESFLNLLSELDEMGYVVAMREHDGELGLAIRKKPEIGEGRIWVNIVLFLATIGTTLFAGFFIWRDFLDAVLFSSGLMAILVAHEMGHKIVTLRHGVSATWPYFFPIPHPYIGTFGAIIKTKSPIPTKEALAEMGASGPISGFLFALPIATVGLMLSEPFGGELFRYLPIPLLFSVLGTYTFGYFPATLSPHPFAWAGFIGFLVTWLNMIPAGQLDGGHVARSLLNRERHYILTRALGFSLVFFGLFIPFLLFFGIIILFLFGAPHSGALDDVSELSREQKFLAFGALTIFILCLPIPI